MSPKVLARPIFFLSAFISSTLAGNTVIRSKPTTQHPLIPILKESFEHWQTIKPILNAHRRPNMENSTFTTPMAFTMMPSYFNTSRLRNNMNYQEDFPSYEGMNNDSGEEKRICKRYFINDTPRKKSVYYINSDSRNGKNILKALPEIYGNSQLIQKLSSSQLLSLPNKRSPNIKVLTIDLIPRNGNSNNTGQTYKTKEIDQDTLLGSRTGKGEFMILIQQPKNQVNINNLLEEMGTTSLKKDTDETEDILEAEMTPQQVQRHNDPEVSAAVGGMLKLLLKSKAYYNDLSSRLNDVYAKILESKAQYNK